MFRCARRLLLIPAVGLVLLGAPAFAVDAPAAPEPTTESVELPVPEADAGPGWQAEANAPANLVGVKWTGDPAAEFQIEVLRPEDATWTPVAVLEGEDTAPDSFSPDAASSATATGADNVTEGVWVGDAQDVRVTVVSGTVDTVSVEAVTSEGAGAPGGSAGALGGSLAGAPDGYAYAIVLVVAGVALGAVAAGWSPWRSRRQLALLGVLALVVAAGCVPPSPNATDATKPPITMRSTWGPDLVWNPSPECAPGPEMAGDVEFVVLHHTVNSNTYAADQSRAMVRAIWQYHVKTLGYCDIAYNFVVDRYGQIFEGRMGGIDKPIIAAHTGGFNRSSSGLAFLGTHTDATNPEHRVTPAAWNAMVDLVAWKLSAHRMAPGNGMRAISNGGGSRWPLGTEVAFPNKILGHRDLWATACPGDAFYLRLAEFRAAVAPKVGWASAT